MKLTVGFVILLGIGATVIAASFFPQKTDIAILDWADKNNPEILQIECPFHGISV